LGLFLRRRERAAGEYRRRNIFELYIEEVVEACNRLKGGKLRVDKLKAQLQKIATSRTGGTKTDEALGKAGGGPEGLPHSIIVTPEGIEGEVAIAMEATDALAHDGAPMADARHADLLPDEKLTKKGGRGKAEVTPAKPSKEEKPAKGKAAQLGLFSEETPTGKISRVKTRKASKGHKARGKK
jgi:DNA topoisomerase-6 subunit B